jgi:large subunit ribosomal protein L22
MSQKANPKRTKDNEAMAHGHYIRGSERKLNLLAQMIRGKKAGRALVDLEFSPRRVAQEVRKVLQSAIANAENNHNLDIDRLVVARATVGKSIKMKRFHARGRGRAASVVKKFSNITIIVAEADEKVAKPKKAEKAKTEKSETKTKSPAKQSSKPKAKKAQGAKA